jgi:tetratricopeptide (TPR) repeat protein
MTAGTNPSRTTPTGQAVCPPSTTPPTPTGTPSTAGDKALSDPHLDPITAAPPLPGVTPLDLADHDQAIVWFTTERAVLLAAVHQAASAGFDTHVWQLATALTKFLNRRGYWHDQIVLQRAALDARRADRSGQTRSNRSLGGAHGYLAHAYARLGRYDDGRAHLQQALDLFGHLGDRFSQAIIHLDLAWLFRLRGSAPEAVDHLQRAVALYPPSGPPVGPVDALNALCSHHPQRGEHQHIIALCLQAVALVQEFGDRDAQARVWGGLGGAHHRLDHPGQAIACYQHTLDLCRDVGDRYYEAETFADLGDIHHAASDPDAAIVAWQHALDILDELDHPDAHQVRTKLKEHNHRQPQHPAPSST